MSSKRYLIFYALILSIVIVINYNLFYLSSYEQYCDKFVNRISLNAFVISNNGARFNHTKVILSRVGFNVSLHTPIKYDSDELNSAFSSQYKETKSLKVNSAKNTSYDYAHLNKSSDKLRKTFSNKIAFETILQTFISSDTFGPDEWIFLFEDDIGMQSEVADPYCAIRSAMLIASPSISLPMPVPVRKKKKNSPPHDKGQRVGDGIIYLGMCRHFTSVCQPLTVSNKKNAKCIFLLYLFTLVNSRVLPL